ncbi:MAG: D-glycero-beta-D-manno-heptose 1-phosphate adenylyltransferase [bacterium]
MTETHHEILERLKIHPDIGDSLTRAAAEHPGVVDSFIELFADHPILEPLARPLFSTYQAIVHSLDEGGIIFVSGNGGSFSDALHITGELLKSFERNRLLSQEERRAFLDLPYGEEVSKQLEHGFRAVVLGANVALASAVQNDFALDKMQYAQELFAMGRKGDVLIGLSTSGNARNVMYAFTTARAIGVKTICLTGEGGGEMAKCADIALRAPAAKTRKIQELHLPIYHTICLMIENHYFHGAKSAPEPPRGSVLDLENLDKAVNLLKKRGKKIVWTNGCFDILHMGHINYLRSAKEQGDILVVGINSDESVRALKGAGRPIIPERQRAEVLSSMGCVDYVTIFSDTDTVRLLERLQPHVYAKGGDYDINSIVQKERRVVEEYGGEIRILPLVQDASTSMIINRIANGASRSRE